MQAFVNSIPEALATAILTAVFTGLLLHYFKIRIENSFAERLENFKANLQKSSTEHQIKFSRTYPKTLEILETYHQKLRNCSKFCHQLHLLFWKAVDSNQPLEDIEIKERKSEFYKVFTEFKAYIPDNRLYIPSELIEELGKITDIASLWGMFSSDLIEETDKPIEELVQSMYRWNKLVNHPPNISIDADSIVMELKADSVDIHLFIDESEESDFEFFRFTNYIEQEFSKLSERVDKLYRSIAEDKK